MSLRFKKIQQSLGLLCVMAVGLIAGFPHSGWSQTNELVILTWPAYLVETLTDRFEQETGTKIKQVFYESEEDRDKLMVETQGEGYDIIVVSRALIPNYIKAGWIAPLDASLLPNLEHIDPQILNEQPEWKTLAVVPYFEGTNGIAYRQDLVSEPITSWKQLFQPPADVKGKLLMMNDTIDVVISAIQTLGISIEDSDTPDALKQIETLLKTQKSFVAKYGYISLEAEQSLLAKGEISVAYAYNGDGLVLQEFHPEIRFAIPEEGCIFFRDYTIVSAKSKQQQRAHQFLNFLNDPKNAAENAQGVYYATANAGATTYLDPEFLSDTTIYPPPEVRSKCIVLPQLPPRTFKKWNQLVERVLHSKDLH